MSDTPICDKHKYETDQGAEVIDLSIAEALERAGRSYDAQIANLLSQVEKMRNCDNCKYFGITLWEDDSAGPCCYCYEKLEKWEATK